jgi:hypothetical protein
MAIDPKKMMVKIKKLIRKKGKRKRDCDKETASENRLS